MKKYLINLLVFSLMACHNNEMKVELKDIIDKVQIAIEIPVKNINKVIYLNKNQIGVIPDAYGENDWLLIYNDSLCARFRHLKLNSRDKHTYLFRFYKNEAAFYCQISIKGEYPVEETIELKQCKGISKL